MADRPRARRERCAGPLSPNGSAVLRVLGAGLRLRVVEGPLVEVEDGRPGSVADPDAELDGLGEDDLLLGRQQRHARDLAQVQARRVLDLEGGLVRVRFGVASCSTLVRPYDRSAVYDSRARS